MIIAIKQGDTYPPLQAYLQMRDGTPIRIEGATVKLILKNESDIVVLNKAVTIEDFDTSYVVYNWVAEDTATEGVFKGEFEITWMEGTILTVPNDGYFTINIVKQLGSDANEVS